MIFNRASFMWGYFFFEKKNRFFLFFSMIFIFFVVYIYYAGNILLKQVVELFSAIILPPLKKEDTKLKIDKILEGYTKIELIKDSCETDLLVYKGTINYYNFAKIITLLSDYFKADFIEIPNNIDDFLLFAYDIETVFISSEGIRKIILLNISYCYFRQKDRRDLSYQYDLCKDYIQDSIYNKLDDDDKYICFDLLLKGKEKNIMFKIHNWLLFNYYMSHENYSEKQVRKILEGKKTEDEL